MKIFEVMMCFILGVAEFEKAVRLKNSSQRVVVIFKYQRRKIVLSILMNAHNALGL